MGNSNAAIVEKKNKFSEKCIVAMCGSRLLVINVDNIEYIEHLNDETSTIHFVSGKFINVSKQTIAFADECDSPARKLLA